MHEAALQQEQVDWLREHCLGLGSIQRRQGCFDSADAMLQRAAECIQESDPEDSGLWHIMLEQARLVQDRGDTTAGHTLLLSLLDTMIARHLKPSRAGVPCVCTDTHPRQLYVFVVLDLAWAEFCSDNWAQALEWCKKALSVICQFHKTGSLLVSAVASAGAAACLMRLQRPEAAEIYAQAASDSLAAYTHKADGIQTALYYYGVYSLLSGQFTQARLHFDRALVMQHHVFAATHPATVYLNAACRDADPPSVAPP